ncbi:hypothetical protein ACFL67_03300 [candidate division KSB1 bacterium]
MRKIFENINPYITYFSTFIILAVPILYYLFVFVPNKAETLTERYLRELAIMGDQINQKGESILNVVQNEKKKDRQKLIKLLDRIPDLKIVKSDADYWDQQISTIEAQSSQKTTAPTEDFGLNAFAKIFLESEAQYKTQIDEAKMKNNWKNLESRDLLYNLIIYTEILDSIYFSTTDLDKFEYYYDDSLFSSDTYTLFEEANKIYEEESSVFITYNFKDNMERIYFDIIDINWSYPQPIFTFWDINNFVGDITEEHDFEDLLIFNEKGDAVFQRSAMDSRKSGIQTMLRVGLLDTLLEKQDKELLKNDIKSELKKEFEEYLLFGQENKQYKEERRLSHRALISNVYDIRLAGKDYKLFLQPVPLKFLGGMDATKLEKQKQSKFYSQGGLIDQVTELSEKKTWVIGGLLSYDAYSERSRTISYNIILLSFLIIFLLLISAPFIKLWLIGRLDFLGRSDIVIICLSILVGMPFIWLSLLDIAVYVPMEDRMKEYIQKTGEEIHKTFINEIKLAHDQLSSFSLLENSKSSEEFNMYKFDDLPEGQVIYPYLDMVFYANSTGKQTKKWLSAPESPVSMIDISSRTYFTAIANSTFWKSNDNKHLILDPIHSYSSGIYEVALAVPYPDDSTEILAAATFRPLSAIDPVLPPGYGFAIIDESGKVIFHSSKQLNAFENFITECNDDDRLKSLVLSGKNDILDLEYHGNRYNASVTSFHEHFPWTLIVFQRKDVLTSLNLELISKSSLLYFSYLLYILFIFLAGLIVYYITTTKEQRKIPGIRWYWKRESLEEEYCTITILNGLFFIVLLLCWIYFFDSFPVILLFVLIPLISIFLFRKLSISESSSHKPVSTLNLITVTLFFFICITNSRIDSQFEFIAWRKMLEIVIAALFAVGYWILLAKERKAAKFIKSTLPDKNYYMAALFSTLLLVIILPSTIIFNYTYKQETEMFKRYSERDMNIQFWEWKQQQKHRYENVDKELLALWGNKPEELSLHINPYFSANYNNQVKAIEQNYPVPAQSNEYNNISQLFPYFTQYTVDSRNLTDTLYVHEAYLSLPEDEKMYISMSGIDLNWSLLGIALGIFFALLFLVLIYRLLNYLGKKLFLIDDKYYFFRKHHEEAYTTLIGNFFAYNRYDKQSKKGESAFDLKNLYDKNDIEIVYEKSKAVCILYNFEYKMHDTVFNYKKLELLETLIHYYQKQVIVYSSFEPLSNFALTLPPVSINEKDAGRQEPGHEENKEYFERWRKILHHFTFGYTDETTEHIEIIRKYEQIYPDQFQEEFEKHSNLNSFLQSLQSEFDKWDKISESHPEAFEHLVNEISRQYYTHVWNASTLEEKFHLIDLAEDGFINTNNEPVIERMLTRGLILNNPVRLVNPSFKDFIESIEDVDRIKRLAKKDYKSVWENLKKPALVILIACIIFLFATQPKILNNSLAVLSTITVGIIPLFLRFFELFRKGSAPTASVE